jgi:hypothetical protein
MFRGLQRAVRKHWGEAAVEALAARPGNDVYEALRYGRIVSVGWYPVGWYCELYKAASSFGTDLSREVGYDTLLHDFTTTQRHVLSLFAPDTVLSHAPRLMSMYWRGGAVEALHLQASSGRVRCSGWVGFDRNVWQDVVGGLRAILVASDARDVVGCVIAGGRDHSRNLELELTWQAGRVAASGG